MPDLGPELVSGGPYAESVLLVGAHMQNLQRPICRTRGVSKGPSLVIRGPSLATPPSHKRRSICLQKALFELERCSNVMIITARCLYSSDRCSRFSVILIPLKSMGPGVIVPPAPPPPSQRLRVCLVLVVF